MTLDAQLADEHTKSNTKAQSRLGFACDLKVAGKDFHFDRTEFR
jgi:polyisoprenoid-binding protein YceI